MYPELVLSNVLFDEIQDDDVDELVSAVSSLYGGGMTRRGISELLNIHEQQVRDLLDAAFRAPLH